MLWFASTAPWYSKTRRSLPLRLRETAQRHLPGRRLEPSASRASGAPPFQVDRDRTPGRRRALGVPFRPRRDPSHEGDNAHRLLRRHVSESAPTME